MSDFPVPDPESAIEPKPLAVQAVDIQHDTDPAQDHGRSRRIPHFGHALLFFSIAFASLSLCGVAVATALHIETEEQSRQHPMASLISLACAYIITLALSARFFPRLWERPFLYGIQWNTIALRRRWFWVLPAGVLTSFIAQWADRHVYTPTDSAIERLFHSQSGAWALALLGTLLFPMMEEIAFRGFLLPALATAYDWLALERTPAAVRRWETTSGHTAAASAFGAVFSTIPFALLHIGQLQHAWGALGVLFGVGLALAFARIKTHSVACSTLMHAAHNFTVFAYAFAISGGFRHLDKL